MAFPLTRRSLLTALPAAAQRGSAKPNVLVILADDLGYGDLSCQGAADVRSPNIDALAASGMRFTNFYSNCPVCSPTRAALLSGTYPDVAGVPGVIRTQRRNSWGYLSPKVSLLPVPLRQAGYHSGIVGKWHLGLSSPNTPTERGFDFFHGFLGDMMDDYWTHRREGNNYMRRNRETIDPQGHATDLFTGWAVDYLADRKRDGKPFFLYLAYNAPHGPVQPPPEWFEKVQRRDPSVPEKRAKLAALIEHMDAGVGKVMDALRQNGQAENTLVVFSSDNGGDRGAAGTAGNLRGFKQDMYEGGIRVPTYFSWPGKIAAGSSSQAVALSMDLYATACDLAGVQPPSGIDGKSIAPVLRGAATSMPERDLFWVRREGGARYEGRDYYAMRRGDWKMLQNSPFEPYQLYNLKDDPLEKADLAKQQPKLMREMSAALSVHCQRAGSTPWQGPV